MKYLYEKCDGQYIFYDEMSEYILCTYRKFESKSSCKYASITNFSNILSYSYGCEYYSYELVVSEKIRGTMSHLKGFLFTRHATR